VTDPGQAKAIEVERTLKSRRRYRQLWSFYAGNLPAGTSVLYITAFPNGSKLLLARTRQERATGVHVCSLEEFKRDPAGCAFRNYRGEAVGLAARPAPPQSIRIGELLRPRGWPDKSASPLGLRSAPSPQLSASAPGDTQLR
ncbi:MAG: hypothetical protein KGL53_07825, partial [Elusimicrobia bacterium]|nr:hypothetical protein [Elusimicrobiota bacterium]